MKKHDLQPIDENIRSTFYKDSIGRNKDLVNFIKIIDSINESYSIALDSYWGSGKTFFVKQVKMILDANNEFTYDSVEERDKVLEKWNQLLGKDIINTNYHIPIYYDAWANDNDNDPILSIVYQIIQTVGNYANIEEPKGLRSVFNLAGDIFALVKGFNPLELAKKLKSENPLEAIMQTKSLKERIDEFIENLIPEHGERLLIIIDELDRCNPDYAVKLLERIKHYFNNDKLTFVFSVNIEELQHTIKKHYGQNFNAQRYLDRFFDWTLKLPKLDKGVYFKTNSIENSVIRSAIEFFDIQMREMPKYFIMCNKNVYQTTECNVHIELKQGKITDGNYGISISVLDFLNMIIIPYLLALKITDNDDYNDFFNGKGVDKLTSFIKSLEVYIRKEICQLLNAQTGIENSIRFFYEKLINTPPVDPSQYETVGYCAITGREKSYLSDLVEEILESMEDEE